MKTSRLMIIILFSSATVLCATYFLARPWISLRKMDTLQVKGYAEIPVKSDSAAMTATIRNASKTLPEAYGACAKQIGELKQLATQSLRNPQITELDTEVSEILRLDEKGVKTNVVENYLVRRTIRIESNEVEAARELSQKINDMNAKGVMTSVEGPSFFVNKLEGVKVDLVRKATENGKTRAVEMAKSAGYKLGRLVSARQGIIQITKMNSSETSDWGMYDTQTIDKVAKLAVTLEFEIE